MTNSRSCGALGGPHSTGEPKRKKKKRESSKVEDRWPVGGAKKEEEEEEEESHLPLFKFHRGPGTIKTRRTMFPEAGARLFFPRVSTKRKRRAEPAKMK